MVNRVVAKEYTPSQYLHALPRNEHNAGTDHLFAAYAYLCRRGARKFWRAGLERCDLEQVAAIGLLKAARRFDPSSTTPFEAYAWLTIIGELGHHVRDFERLVRVPRRLKSLEPSVTRARDACIARLGREPREGEIAEELGVTAGIVRDVRAAAAATTVVALDDPAARSLACDASLAIEDRVLVGEAFARLTALERRVLIGVDVLGITQLEIGRILGMSPRRVSRVRKNALTTMQRAWAS